MEHYLLPDEALQRRVPNLSALNEGDESCHRILVYGFVFSIESHGLSFVYRKENQKCVG